MILLNQLMKQLKIARSQQKTGLRGIVAWQQVAVVENFPPPVKVSEKIGLAISYKTGREVSFNGKVSNRFLFRQQINVRHMVGTTSQA